MYTFERRSGPRLRETDNIRYGHLALTGITAVGILLVNATGRQVKRTDSRNTRCRRCNIKQASISSGHTLPTQWIDTVLICTGYSKISAVYCLDTHKYIDKEIEFMSKTCIATWWACSPLKPKCSERETDGIVYEIRGLSTHCDEQI